MAENVIIGGIGLALMVITIGISIWQEQFNGGDTLADNFSGMNAPTGFLSFLDFVKDLALAVSKSVVDLMLFEIEELPDSVNDVIRVVWGLVFGTGLLLALVAVLS